MKICVIFPKDSEAIFDTTSSRTFGGATVQMFAIANELVNDKGNDVFCIIPKIKNKHNLEKISLRVIEAFNIKKTIFETIFLFHKKIQKEKPDVIIQHGLTLFSCLLSFYCYFYKIKFVFMFAHDDEVQGIYQSSKKRCFLFPLLLNTKTILITQNTFQYNFLLTKGANTTLLKIGFSIKEPLKEKQKNILWIARCEEWKQPDFFINLARNNSDKSFVMICPKVKEDYFLKIKKTASEVSNLTFIDYVSFEQTWKYFEEACLFINTSVAEGFPQTFIQSVSRGVPIITLNANPDNFILDNVCGFVCGGDVKKLDSNLNKILEDKNTYEKISSNCIDYAKKNHSFEKNILKLTNLLKK